MIGKIALGVLALALVAAVLALLGFLGWLGWMTVRHGRLLVPLALRSIATHRVKTLIVGGILGLGTFLLVLGLAALGNIERAMEQGITGSLVGHLQIFSEEARDDVVFYGPQAGTTQDLGNIPDWGKTKAAVSAIDGVEAVVPMGRDVATAVGGNELDEVLGKLRAAVKAGEEKNVVRYGERIRQMLEVLKPEIENRAAISSNKEETARQLAVLGRALSPALWAELATDPEGTLEYLDTQVAPLQSDSAVLFMPYVGADLQAFAKSFDRFQIVMGELPPPGERGFLMNQAFYDAQVKNKVVRWLDLVHKALTEEGKTIAGETALQQNLQKAQRQFRRVLLDVDPDRHETFEQELARFMQMDGQPAEVVLPKFLELDDANFKARYDFLYAKLVPHMRLYRVGIGEILTLRTFTRSGYTKAANLKVWGTFTYKGLEGSPVASNYNMIDLMSFRDLYGLMTPERRKELEAMRAEVGVETISRDEAEDALFGDPSELEAAVGAEELAFGEAQAEEPLVASALARGGEALKPFTQADIDGGVVVNAAVVLKEGANEMLVAQKIDEVSKAESLGIKSINWRVASGIVGQLIGVLYGILIVVLLIIGVVALVIVNNSILMATMDRIGEVGTMRAIGAQRNLILAMFALESVILTVAASAVGALLAGTLVAVLGHTGLNAPTMGNGIFLLLFGGKVLYPTLSVAQVVGGVFLVSIVALVATLYPAFSATRVPPIVAMQRRE